LPSSAYIIAWSGVIHSENMVCEKCDCGEQAHETGDTPKRANGANEIDMTAMWTPRNTGTVPERGIARREDARTETEEQCPGFSSDKCCKASQEVSKLIPRDIDNRKPDEHLTVSYPAI
jgi:hypothetical protein